jgi:hypothetical protein
VTDEAVLTPANVSGLKILFQKTVDGQIYAQPLCVSNQLVFSHGVSQGTHDIVIVATENDSVYAFDAAAGTLYWQVSLLSPGDKAVPASATGTSDLAPIVGITATPVIDRNAGPNGQLFVVAFETDGNGNFDYKLHALNLATGNDALTPVTISASVSGAGPATTFAALHQRSRSALLLLNSTVYTAWGSFGDIPPYAGWVIGYRESDLSQTSVFNTNPNGSPASTFLPDGSGNSIWQAGLGPSADTSGNIYFATANGPFDTTLSNGFPANSDFGDSVIKLSGSTVSDYFTPHNQLNMATHDQDLGGGGVVLLPPITDTNGATHSLGVLVSKGGSIYVVDRNNLGHFNPTTDTSYQKLNKALGSVASSNIAFFNNSIYGCSTKQPLKRFSFDFTNPNKPLLTEAAHTSVSMGYRGCTPSISSNGGSNGIVWAYDYIPSHPILFAFDPVSLNQLFSSGTLLSAGVKFAVPTIFSGKVYVGTKKSVVAFGL